MFNSDARQDEFIANLFNFKKEGAYVDIGSCGAVGSNNTYFFENPDMLIDKNYGGELARLLGNRSCWEVCSCWETILFESC